MRKQDFRAVLFDLDGTLLNTIDDIADSANLALSACGLPTHGVESYKMFVGNGVAELIARCVGPSLRDASVRDEAERLYREHYAKNCRNKTRPYSNISELFGELSRRGVLYAVLSNKPDAETRFVVGEFFPKANFASVAGHKDGAEPKPSPEGALLIARELGIPPEAFLYLGDTSVDMRTAVSADMFPVGALWGFRSRGELLKSGAKTLIDDPLALLDLL